MSPGPPLPPAGCPPPGAPGRTAQAGMPARTGPPPQSGPDPLPRLGRVEELHYDLERDAVRVVLTDDGGRVLLFHVLTPDHEPDGWWELPGGGIDPGESY